MADKSTQLVLDALSQAAADPAGVPLHGSKAAPGLFAGTAPGKQAAQRCKDEGYLRVLRTETKGKTVHEVCAITEKGLAYLLGQVSPKQVLEDFVRALEARQGQVGDLVAAARQAQASLDGLRATVETVLHAVGSGQPAVASQNGQVLGGGEAKGSRAPARETPPPDAWTAVALSYLTKWQASGASEDCPLAELYRQARAAAPELTVGNFHDGLRRLHDQEQIYLHPWTGPLYDIPEPPYALLVGHDIAYYASRREK
jgi:hypothetical protein